MVTRLRETPKRCLTSNGRDTTEYNPLTWSSHSISSYWASCSTTCPKIHLPPQASDADCLMPCISTISYREREENEGVINKSDC